MSRHIHRFRVTHGTLRGVDAAYRPALLRRECAGCGAVEVAEGESSYKDPYTAAIALDGWREQTDPDKRRTWLKV